MRLSTIALLFATSLADFDVAPTADWRTVIIPVSDIEDPIVTTEDSVHSPPDTRCEVVDGDGIDVPAGEACTLRAAIELANTLERTVVTVAITAGRIVLAAPLPEIQGTLQLVGSAPIARTAQRARYGRQ